MSFRITFLGTGGGRFTTMYQSRSTGGLLIENEGRFAHIDPGPGALTAMHRIHYDPFRTEAVAVSHCHPDHFSDAPTVIEGMTSGGWIKRGAFYGTAAVTGCAGGMGPAITPYHLRLPEKCSTIAPGDLIDLAGVKTSIKKAVHNDPFNIGFRMETPYGDVSYLSDTEYYEDIGEQYIGSRVLILPVTTPQGVLIKGHMNTDGAVSICRQVKPELCIFIHLGIDMLKHVPEKEAQKCQDASGVRTVAGRDYMVLEVGEKITVSDAEKFPENDGWFPPRNPHSRQPNRGRFL